MVRDSESEAAREAHDRQMADAVNPRMQLARQRALPVSKRVLRDSDFFRPGDPAFAELRERLAAIRLGQFMSVGAPLPGGERLALVLHRDVDDRREFEAQEESFALELAPHLLQAVQLADRYDAARERSVVDERGTPDIPLSRGDLTTEANDRGCCT
jgi:hypothetical protein